MTDLIKMSVKQLTDSAILDGRTSEVLNELARRLAEAEARAEKHFVDKLGEKAVRMVMESNVDIWKARAEAAEEVVGLVHGSLAFHADAVSCEVMRRVAKLLGVPPRAPSARQQATAEPGDRVGGA